MVFIDADVFIAWNHASDSNHIKAVKLFERLDKNQIKLTTSWEVIDETGTKLSQFLTKDVAMKFLERVFSSTIEVVYTDIRYRMEAIELFGKQRSKMVSLTDCVNMVICKDLGIKRIFSFDKHYQQNGLQLLA
jgi:predicted nucleic acid-binding protein